ncbi:Hha/YmoA family nucleoid-associated regulatory protein [Pantoea allii]|uniref:Hha/YmoA family nucleoid-associated regulatory protein n=1 Tax=Pantoea allii TaxID=574096 RepID=UPI003B97D6CB
MNKTDWLMKFRRCRSAETLETVYEHLMYSDHTDQQYEITRAHDHRKAENLPQVSSMTVFLLMSGNS